MAIIPSGGSDYEAHILTPLLLPAGSPIGHLSCSSITLINDEKVEEPLEEFIVGLSSDDPVDFFVANGSIFILDDDGNNRI